MPNSYNNVQRPASLLHYAKLHNLDPRWVALNIPLLWHSFYFRKDDCDATLDSAIWTTNTDATATAFALNAQRNGAFRGATGTTDNGLAGLRFANLIFDAADNPGFYIRFLTPAAVTGFAYEVGFSDAKTDETLLSTTALTAAAVPTTGNGITDYVAVVMDTDLTLTTSAFVGDGTTGAAVGVAVDTYTPAVSRYVEIIVEFSANLGRCQIWDDGTLIGAFGVTNGPDAAILVSPFCLFGTRDTTSKQIDIDLMCMWAERNRTS